MRNMLGLGLDHPTHPISSPLPRAASTASTHLHPAQGHFQTGCPTLFGSTTAEKGGVNSHQSQLVSRSQPHPP